MNPPYSRHTTKPVAGLTSLLALPMLLMSAGALAQNAPVPMPPRLEPLPEIQQPNITTPAPAIRPGQSDSRPGTTDSRDNTGAVVETQVRTPVSTYVVRPNRQVGNAQPGDAQSVGNRAAQFKIGEFGLGRTKPEPQPQAPEPAPMPPVMPSKN